MVAFPTSLLERLYEADSLTNTDTGFELSFKNRLAPTTLIGVGSLCIDGQVFDSTDLVLTVVRPAVRHGRSPEPLVRTGSEVTAAKSLPFGLNAVARLSIAGKRLPPGSYTVSWSFRTKEVGEITVKATDVVEA
jgi:hypothetical protein